MLGEEMLGEGEKKSEERQSPGPNPGEGPRSGGGKGRKDGVEQKMRAVSGRH